MLKVPVHQVAGHRASDGNLGPLVDDSGRFYKPLQGDERGSNEVAFYTSFSSNTKIPDHIRRFFPVFHGTQLLEASDGSGLCPHLVLQDLVSSCVNPSIMDIKIGASTWPPQASEDYIAKCLKKDREGTSIQLGFRISGFQIYGSKESGFWKADKQFIKSFSTEDVRLVLRKFVSNNASADLDSDPDCAFASVVYGGSSGILAQLLELKAWFEDQTIFHFYSCSVLMMYEKELTVEGRSSGAAVKLVDFAHVVEGGGVIDHNFLACFFTCINLCWALDSDSLQDTCPTATATAAQQPIFINGFPCKNPATVTASDFKSSKLNQSGNKENFARSFTVIVTALDFPGLNTLGLGAARTDLEVDGLVLPHSHPRASEMFYVSKGFVIAGFIDTQNQLFQKFLRQGDVFVFPRGLLHYCLNAGFEPATAFSVLNSQNPGVVSIAGAMFDSEAINILAKKLISLSASGMERVDNVTLFGF